jgi:hypothetical protein
MNLLTKTILVALDLKYDTGGDNPFDKGHEILNVLGKINAAASGRKFKRISAKDFSGIAETIECEWHKLIH